jgi:hypothetical protein
MKTLRRFPGSSVGVVLLALCAWTTSYAQITPSGDAYTNTATPTTALGTKTVLDVESGSQTTYIQFDLSSIPAGYTSASIAKATLKLYVNAVTAAGSFNVDYVNGTWSEKTITASVAPALGTTIVSSVPLTSANVHDYILIDVTSAMGAWLDGTEPNDGIALVANSPLNASFDSKENTTNSHSAELDVVFAGGGTISGVTTASGSGLTGGGTSGTLNLGLTNTCAAHQVLQWSGSAWACSSAGSGSVISVASGAGLMGGPITSTGTLSIAPAGVTNAMLASPSLTVSAGTGLAGGGPVALGGTTTLTLDTSKVPELNTANSFTGNQAVTGNLTATGSVGVGIATPLAELDVLGPAGRNHTPIARFGDTSLGDSNSTVVYSAFGNTEVFSVGSVGAMMPGAGPGDGGLRITPGFKIFFGDSGLARMVLASDGTVGIPNTLVTGNTTLNNMGCGSIFGGIGFGANGSTGCANYSLLGEGVHTYLNRSAGGQILFREGNATEMVLASGGNLGIGTTNPQYPLHVNGTMRSETGLSLGGNATVAVDAPGKVGGHFTVLPNGNVGIGTPTPTNTLDVRGGLTINSDTPMTSNPHMSFSTMFMGSLCNLAPQCGFGTGSHWGAFVPDHNIMITRITITLNSAIDPSCTPANVVVYNYPNWTVLGSVTIPGNVYFVDSGALSINAPAGVALVVLPSLDSGNCNVGASAGGDVYMNTQYVMR